MAEFKRDLEWVERLDVTLGPVPGIRGPQATSQNKDQKAVDPEDDFQREMNLYVCFQMWQRLWVPVLERGTPRACTQRCRKPGCREEVFGLKS